MHKKIKNLTLCAMLSAVYVALTMGLPVPQYGAIQLRVAEAMMVLPFYFPAASAGLTVGCVLANLASPYGALDLVAGSMATLLSCLWTRRLKHRAFVALPATICNAVIVGAVIAYAESGNVGTFLRAYAFNALSVGLGELVACGILGSILLAAVENNAQFLDDFSRK